MDSVRAWLSTSGGGGAGDGSPIQTTAKKPGNLPFLFVPCKEVKKQDLRDESQPWDL
jgi:hypothetical protein